MGQERLNTMMLLHIHSTDTDKLDLDSDVNKTTTLNTKTTIGKTKTKTKEGKTKTKTKVGKTNIKTKTNAIAADNVIIISKVAIIVSFYSTIFRMFSLFFIITFFALYASKVSLVPVLREAVCTPRP